MQQTQAIKPYIMAQLAAGVSVEVVRQHLASHGWDGSLVDETVREAVSAQLANSPEAGQSRPLSGQRIRLEPINKVVPEPIPKPQAVTGAVDKEPPSGGEAPKTKGG